MTRRDSRDIGTDGLQYDNEFWRFSLAVYEQADVAKECLALQQSLGIDVNLLLFCAWTGARAIVLSIADIEAASSAVAAWHEQVVRPLRGVRQHVKMFGRDEFENFRTRVKGIELEAEQIEQAILFDHSQRIEISPVSANLHDAVSHNINKYIGMKSGAASAPHLIGAAAYFKSA